MAIKGASKVGAVAPVDTAAAERFEFSEAIEGNRDQWGRPKIMLPDGSKEVGYRRREMPRATCRSFQRSNALASSSGAPYELARR